MKDLIIIGSGPAGITAGIYAARKNLNTLILTKDFIGQLGNSGRIENWPGEKQINGPELLNNFQDHLDSYKIELKEKTVQKIKKENNFKVITDNEVYKSKAVIVASGRISRKIGVIGEKKFTGKGVSYCVTCDGALFKDKNVVVVGAGNAGLEGALELSDYVKKVTILELEDKPQADELLVERIKSRKNVEIITKAKPIEIKGDNFVSKIIYKDLESGKKISLSAKGIFIEIGSIPNTNFLMDLINLNNKGEIKADKNCKTDMKGLFAAGDVTNVRDKQIVVATGEGAKAAISAYNYIKN